MLIESVAVLVAAEVLATVSVAGAVSEAVLLKFLKVIAAESEVDMVSVAARVRVEVLATVSLVVIVSEIALVNTLVCAAMSEIELVSVADLVNDRALLATVSVAVEIESVAVLSFPLRLVAESLREVVSVAVLVNV